MPALLVEKEPIMNGKLYIIGAPPAIFSGLTPDLQARMEYVDNFLHYPKE